MLGDRPSTDYRHFPTLRSENTAEGHLCRGSAPGLGSTVSPLPLSYSDPSVIASEARASGWAILPASKDDALGDLQLSVEPEEIMGRTI